MSFLDVNITRENEGKMETGVDRKPTHTDVYLGMEWIRCQIILFHIKVGYVTHLHIYKNCV